MKHNGADMTILFLLCRRVLVEGKEGELLLIYIDLLCLFSVHFNLSQSALVTCLAVNTKDGSDQSGGEKYRRILINVSY